MLTLHLARSTVFLAAMTLLLVLLVRVSRLKSAIMHRAIWGTALLVSLVGFAIPIVVPVVGEPETPWQASPEPSDNAAAMSPFDPQPSRQHELSIPQTSTETIAAPLLPEPQIAEPSVYDIVQTWLMQHWQSLVLSVWGLGVVVLLARRLVSHAMLTVRLFRQVKPIDDATLACWETLLVRHGFRRTAVPIRLTESVGPAITRSGCGFVLLIPETLWDELSPELRDGVLRHELGHLVHRDTLLALPVFVLAALQWFNPAAWYALKRYNEASEWHADEFAYGTQSDGSSLLAETFLVIHRSTESLGFYLHSFARFSTLDRVDHLITLEQSGKEHAMKKFFVGAVALTLLFAGTFRVEFVAVAKTETSETSVATEPQIPEIPSETPITPEPEETVSPVTAKQTVMQEGFRMTGRVLMPDGTPAKNAAIAGAGFRNTNTVYGYTITTDQEGRYDFESFLHGPDIDAFSFQAYLSHYPENTPEEELHDVFARYRLPEIFEPLVSDIKTFYRDDSNGMRLIRIECDFTLQEGFPLHGTVRYTDGTPAKNAVVGFIPTKTPEVFKEPMCANFSRGARTDDEGKYLIYLSPGEYRISAYQGQNDETAEVGPGSNPEVDLVLKKITLVRFLRADGTPLFQTSPKHALNLSCWKIGELDASGNPTTLSMGSGGYMNNNGDIEEVPQGETYILFMSDDFQEGFVGKIPTGLDNLAVYAAQLVPTAKARFRILDASENPLVRRDVFCYVKVKHTLGGESCTGLRVGDVIRTDDQGYVTIPVPALGEFADCFRYQLDVSHPKNKNVKARIEPIFTPTTPGKTTDCGNVVLDDSAGNKPTE